jgi:hypothetical protein
MRSVKYGFTQEGLEETYDASCYSEVWRAIGYLSTWAVDTYDEVEVYIFTDNEIGATYRSSTNPDKQHYHIRGILRDNRTYGFHS